MKMSFLCIVLLLNTTVLLAQLDSIEKIEPLYVGNPIDTYFDTVSFNLGAGAFIPQGRLKDYIGRSPFVELNLNFPIKENKSLDVVAQFIVPNQKEGFAYARIQDTLSTKAAFIFNGFLRFKVDVFSKKYSRFNINTGIGVSTISTNARNLDFKDEDDQNKYETINAFLISPGLEYRVQFKSNQAFCFGVNIHYSPYRVEGALQEDIGSLAIMPKLLYKF